ncbi:ATP-binding protein [Pontivivens insulae]|uniref:histidine kinase n=1 Tax=Pontivivens insulae TaxID=1639689 RepID=A0A2R8AB53_9RHOB|nr:ATP-binding protein [Pontivivens insulae]RED13196.1 two-component system osmolarity sensor histidine kinase EnvZ [Pontivivens insulae]SPF29288.1 Osmolarity sensor protein EnvZ [Pontivivens insulae]
MLDFSWLKKYTPRNLLGRALLILFVPVVGIQIVTAAVFINRHVEGVTAQMTQSVGAELNYAIQIITREPDEDARQRQMETISALLGLTIFLDEDGTVEPGAELRSFDISGRALVETLQDSIDRPMFVDMTAIDKIVLVEVATPAGVVSALIPRRRVIASNPHQLVLWIVFAAAIFATISTLFLRNQIRPIRELAHASEAFGKGRSVKFKPRGAEEVRRAGNAFLAMRTRIERQIGQRTSMLSGVSHDLRTPLTRMRLAISLADPSPEMEELAHDVQEMERMLDGFLAFARGEGAEPTRLTDPIELARTQVTNTRRAGTSISLTVQSSTPDEPEVQLRQTAIGRALANLISNAARYGDTVRVSVALDRLTLTFTVEDDGVGIPEADRETALKPFTRLDVARNQDSGGSVGLGLSIAADVARSHGGTLTLSESPQMGGLMATLRIPR